MKSHHRRLLLAVLLCAAPLAARSDTPPEPPVSFTDALTQGKVSLNARLRYEFVEQDGTLEDAHALTARLRLGYATKPYKGFQAMVEGEAVTPLVKDYYDGTGTNTSGYPVVADPEVYRLNQAWVSYAYEKTKGTLGRQKLILDNARFVGDVGWRQNDQTFDAVVLQDKTFAHTTLTYAYLDRINRIFDDSGAQPDYDSRSHLFHASHAGLPIGTLTAYAYLLDFDADTAAGRPAARNNSSATYGLSLAGARPLTETLKATYRLEYARQTDYGNSALDYDADYYSIELGVAAKPFTLAAGYEVLGSDGGVASFRTPLATLHAFNGWADVFLVTPPAGLTDAYLKAGLALPRDVALTAFYHVFGTDDGPSQVGTEFDLLATWKATRRLSLTAKFAKYWSDEAGFADRTKVWLQADFAY